MMNDDLKRALEDLDRAADRVSRLLARERTSARERQRHARDMEEWRRDKDRALKRDLEDLSAFVDKHEHTEDLEALVEVAKTLWGDRAVEHPHVSPFARLLSVLDRMPRFVAVGARESINKRLGRSHPIQDLRAMVRGSARDGG